MDIQNLKITVGQMRNLLIAMRQVEGFPEDSWSTWTTSTSTKGQKNKGTQRKDKKAN